MTEFIREIPLSAEDKNYLESLRRLKPRERKKYFGMDYTFRKINGRYTNFLTILFLLGFVFSIFSFKPAIIALFFCSTLIVFFVYRMRTDALQKSHFSKALKADTKRVYHMEFIGMKNRESRAFLASSGDTVLGFEVMRGKEKLQLLFEGTRMEQDKAALLSGIQGMLPGTILEGEITTAGNVILAIRDPNAVIKPAMDSAKPAEVKKETVTLNDDDIRLRNKYIARQLGGLMAGQVFIVLALLLLAFYMLTRATGDYDAGRTISHLIKSIFVIIVMSVVFMTSITKIKQLKQNRLQEWKDIYEVVFVRYHRIGRNPRQSSLVTKQGETVITFPIQDSVPGYWKTNALAKSVTPGERLRLEMLAESTIILRLAKS